MAPQKTNRLVLFVLYGAALPFTLWGQSTLISTSKTLFEERSFQKAKNILVTISKPDRDYPEAQYYLGRIAVEEKAYDLSVEKFEEAINSNPKIAEYHNWLGVMYGVVALNGNSLKQAYFAPKIKNEFEKAAALEPYNLQTQWGLISYYVKAPFFLGGSWDKALVSAKVISSLDKVQGFRAYAFVHAAQKKTALAEKEYTEAMVAEPANCENTFALAQFYFDEQKYDKAFGLYEDVIRKYPLNRVAAFHFGFVSAHSGLQFEKGIKCLIEYLAYTPRPNEPGHSEANLSLGTIYEKKGDLSKAKKYYETSLALHPGMREAKEGLARVN